MAAFEQSFGLQVGSRTENLALIRGFVNHVAAQAGLNEVETGQLELAVDEACANVIEHAYGNDATKEVVVRAVFDDDALRIEIIDSGQGFDPGAIPESDLKQLVAERKTGGLGLRLIRSLVDEVHYEVEPGKKNELRMVKKLRRHD
jgi:serine/threonine-protein kinase RsbW